MHDVLCILSETSYKPILPARHKQLFTGMRVGTNFYVFAPSGYCNKLTFVIPSYFPRGAKPYRNSVGSIRRVSQSTFGLLQNVQIYMHKCQPPRRPALKLLYKKEMRLSPSLLDFIVCRECHRIVSLRLRASAIRVGGTRTLPIQFPSCCTSTPYFSRVRCAPSP